MQRVDWSNTKHGIVLETSIFEWQEDHQEDSIQLIISPTIFADNEDKTNARQGTTLGPGNVICNNFNLCKMGLENSDSLGVNYSKSCFLQGAKNAEEILSFCNF